MTSMYDVLKASKGVPVNDMLAELWGRKLSRDYTITTYTGTLPATLTDTKAGNLHRYKIYGNTEQSGTPTPENPIVPQECGERTENLFDKDAPRAMKQYLNYDGSLSKSPDDISTTDFIKIDSLTVYTITATGSLRCKEFDDAQNPIRTNTYNDFNIHANSGGTFTSSANAAYLRFSIQPNYIDTLTLTEGSTAPESYIPYGYKLPLLSGSTPVDIYIGDDTISPEEYVDSGTGKIYRMVSGVLTPVDPPVPFPQIPTTVGSTTISWAGQGLEPSEVDFEYERK